MPQKQLVIQKEFVPLGFMIEQLRESVGLDTELLNPVEGWQERRIVERNIHRPGLVLAGYTDLFQAQRVQILGNTETRFLLNMDEATRARAFGTLLSYDLPCIVLTAENDLPPDMLAQATARGVPVFRSPAPTTRFMSQLGDFLEDQFAQQTTVHGSLVDVYGVGLLLVGRAGIGKSEIALDLVERGHRLVADDVVIVTRKHNVLMGAGTDLVQHFMEIRGLGIIDARAMFGIRAIRFQKRVEVVVNLQIWDEDEEYTRISMVDETRDILDVALPLVKLPVTPGKNVTVICEVIAMNYLLQHYGYDPAQVFSERLAARMQNKGEGPRRNTEYFENDYE